MCRNNSFLDVGVDPLQGYSLNYITFMFCMIGFIVSGCCYILCYPNRKLGSNCCSGYRCCWGKFIRKITVENWLEEFVQKLKRTSTRSQKCRLILSIERMLLVENDYANRWQRLRISEDYGEIFDEQFSRIQKIKTTEFQRLLLRYDAALKNHLISRSDVSEENGNWHIPAELLPKIISEGGEALVLSEEFGSLKTAVRVQIFDPFLFTKDFGVDSISWKIHMRESQFL